MSIFKIKDDSKETRRKALAALPNDVQTIGGFGLPIGKHYLLVAEKDAFGLLNITRKSDGQRFALPIVAGTITLESGGGKIAVEISDRPSAKTLVVPKNYYVEMQCNADYEITVEERNGRKVVTNVVPAEVEEEPNEN